MASLGHLRKRRERRVARESDLHAASFWADDDDVEIQKFAENEHNAVHGKNSRFGLNWRENK